MKQLIVIAFTLAILGIYPANTAIAKTKVQEPGVMYANVQVANQLYEETRSNQLIARAESLKGKRTGQCVPAVRQFLGISRNEIQGFARNTKINTQTPQVGAIVVLKMSRAGHVGAVLQVYDTYILYYDSNGDNRGRSNIRTININSPLIRGYRTI